MTDKQIRDWKEKLNAEYGDQSKMYEYLFQTLDNFYYRYLETTINKDLKTTQMGLHLWGANSREDSMVDALKINNPTAKKGIIQLAKTVPKSQGPYVKYELLADVEELRPDHGKIKITAKIDWGFPDFQNEGNSYIKKITFIYEDLAHFRKELAQKLEEACEIFL